MIDVKNPVTNPDLVLAISRAREQSTAETWADMMREVTKARFLAPVDICDGDRASKQETAFSLPMLVEPADGQKYFLAFTDWKELEKWRSLKDQRILIMTFEDYSQIVLDSKMQTGGFIINPYGGNIVISRAMLAAMRREKEERTDRGPERVVMEKGTTVQLGQPEDFPEALIAAISGYLKTRDTVEAAYLQLMEFEGTASYLVAVDFERDQKALFDGLFGVTAGILHDMPLNLVSCESDFWRETTQGLAPFYRKEPPRA